MSEHTPGPWQCYCDGPTTDPSWHIVTNESRMRVIANIRIECPMDDANARLIAAAPDLLAACKRAMAFFQTNHPAPYAVPAAEVISAAIAKAEGRDPR